MPQVPSAALNTLLVVRALVCAAANLTTNELMRPARFGYLADSRDDTFLNPFDAGPAANCLQFWRAPRAPDWGAAYSELMQVAHSFAAEYVRICTVLPLGESLARRRWHSIPAMVHKLERITMCKQ